MTAEASIKSYRDLLVWQKGMALAVQMYCLTTGFPDEEKFGLVAQMRRAAVSGPSNVAEGQARHGRKEFIHSLSHAEGSLAELDTQVELSGKLGYGSDSGREEVFKLISELQKMLSALRQRLLANLVAGGSARVGVRGTSNANHQPLSTRH